ncbi:possible transcriptional regulator, TetR family protein [Oceanicaulis alexandrii HTCC2633]|uniref:TetR/AcrR family transcriptional regulator n=1 Tax=Oceanicaulis sp. HTCC2633 TaxID=314254 RepID=UPI0000668AB2|nr:TetR/AcrR family transcriptional regulator [Oceanicaulis sp. HTCC2633]EAP90468.1 possible transcriptional regulator, TetR family protein [Oceanicaulis alexandrii HTCC2633] [Oceanicaulis sp. HTCC2633]
MQRAAPYDRNEALKAAQDLFWRKGYHATSLKDLEAALNMKPGSIYAAFKSKHALYLTCLERYFDETVAALDARLEASPTVLDALADFVRAFGREHLASETPVRVCMLVKTALEATEDEPELRDRAQAYLLKMRAAFETCFRQAQQTGEVSGDHDPAQLAVNLQADITAIRIEAQQTGGSITTAWLANRKAQDVLALRDSPAH